MIESVKYEERYKIIGQNIAKYRKQKGLSQEELANGVGISYSYIILMFYFALNSI